MLDWYSGYMKAAKIAKEFRESMEGIKLEGFMKRLKYIAEEWLLFHNNTTCCFDYTKRHFGFQCKFHEECVITSYNTNDYTHF